ncbi:hypothetical protein BDV98DRAFT_577929 [Pterulicium gracile]|uniref:Secreted protein n=1 Tax=Pterulicium gracile TaxID=1884261 RepID=A0A5C3Q0I9_9AGAR|nr:hypothetical protein BDV98DRAFT_577929 [Pterula gracilis]
MTLPWISILTLSPSSSSLSLCPPWSVSTRTLRTSRSACMKIMSFGTPCAPGLSAALEGTEFTIRGLLLGSRESGDVFSDIVD